MSNLLLLDCGSGHPPGGPFSSPLGLDYFYTDSRMLAYEDSAATIPALDEADTVAAIKTQAGVTAVQVTEAQEANLDLNVALFGGTGKNALSFVDDPTTPTTTQWMEITNHIQAGHNTNFIFIAEIARLAGLTNTGYITCEQGAASRFSLTQGNGLINASFTFVPSCQLYTSDDDVGVVGVFWDGTWVRLRWNCFEQAYEDDGVAPSISLVANDEQRIGNAATANATNAARSLAMFTPMLITAPPTKANRDLEFNEHGRVMGLVNSGKGKKKFIVVGNSLAAGFPASGYTSPWPTQLGTLLGTTNYEVVNISFAGHTILQRAAVLCDSSNSPRNNGHFDAGKLLRISAVTDANTFDVVIDNGGGAPGLGATGWEGYVAVLESGTQDGMGQVVSSHDTNTITLSSFGFPAAPAIGDTLRLYKPSNQNTHIVGAFHEKRNSLVASGATDGPAAAGGVKTSCLLYKQDVCAQIAFKAVTGAYMIGMPIFPDATAEPYANYYEDIVTWNTWMEDQTHFTYDAILNIASDCPSMATNPGANYVDDVHFSNTGAGVVAAAMKVKANALNGW